LYHNNLQLKGLFAGGSGHPLSGMAEISSSFCVLSAVF
jgi:hypothetical protein